MWGEMRMNAADLADVTGSTYTYLMNGQAPAGNWTGLFTPGERVRLRFINGSAMSYFDVRIPGLKMTVVAADGLHVQPVTVDEFRIAVAETYDVIVEPTGQDAFTIFAQAMDRTGFAAGTLAVRDGPARAGAELDPRPMLTMADMGHGDAARGPHDAGAARGGGRDPHAGHDMPHAAAPADPHAGTTCPRRRPAGASGEREGQSARRHADDDADGQARRSGHRPAGQRPARADLRRPAQRVRRSRRTRTRPHDRAAPDRPHGALRLVVRRHQVLGCRAAAAAPTASACASCW